MSAETFIQEYLDGKIDLKDKELVTESRINIDINPIKSAVKAISSIRKTKDVIAVSNKSANIRTAAKKTIQDVDELYKGLGEKVPLPISQTPISNEKSADTYLRSYFNYSKSKIANLEWRELARAYINSKTVVTNVLVSAGILGAGAALGGGAAAMTSKGNMSGKSVAAAGLAGGAIVSILALILVVMSVSNAVSKSKDLSEDGKPIIDFKTGWRTVIQSFKDVFSGKDRSPEASALAKVTAFIVPLTLFFALTFGKHWTNFAARGGQLVAQAIRYITGMGWVALTSIWSAKDYIKDWGEEMLTGVKPVSVNTGVFKAGRKNVSTLVTKAGMSTINAERGIQAGKLMAYVILPVLCLSVVMYLFSELLDAFQLRKLESMHDQEEEQQSYDDIL